MQRIPFSGLHLITGPMFSGKTELLIDLLDAAEAQGERVVRLKPIVDDRVPRNQLVSHTGTTRGAVAVMSGEELRRAIDGADVVGLDEAQFASSDVLDALQESLEANAPTVAAGLDLDFRGDAFPATARLANLARIVERLTAVCGRCGNAATHTQRLIGGMPAPLDDPLLLVGASELYEPRCAECFFRERDLPLRALRDATDSELGVRRACS